MQKFQDEHPALLPCLMFNSETFMETNTHKKVKVGYLYKSKQAFKSCVVFWLVVGPSGLAFGLASSFKQWLSLLVVSLKYPLYSPLYAARFSSFHSARPTTAKPVHLHWCWILFWRILLCGLNTHMFPHTARRFQTALAACLRYGNYRWFELALPQQFGCQFWSQLCFICRVKSVWVRRRTAFRKP